MNKRIQELAEQAGMYVDLDSKPWPKWMSAEESVAAYEKFAELIVRECISMADDFECDVNQRGLVDQIKQHFGVK